MAFRPASIGVGNRLGKAKRLPVEWAVPGEKALVASQSNPAKKYEVERKMVSGKLMVTCTCVDFAIRGRKSLGTLKCKHILAVELDVQNNDPAADLLTEREKEAIRKLAKKGAS